MNEPDDTLAIIALALAWIVLTTLMWTRALL